MSFARFAAFSRSPAKRKEGLNVYYGIADCGVFDRCNLVCSRLQAGLESKAAHLKTKAFF